MNVQHTAKRAMWPRAASIAGGLLALAAALPALAWGMSMGKFCLFSAVEGVVLERGQPVPGAQIERSYSWTWKKQQGTDQASTDAQGRFQFPAIQGSSFFRGFLPHEPMVEQTILIHHGGKTYKAWMFDKRNYEQNGELAGKPIVLSCSLETEPRHSGKVFGICELK